MTSGEKQEPQLSPIYSVLVEIEPKLLGVGYNFTTTEDFSVIDSIAEMQMVYWCEMVQRMHICASTSLKRVKKWYDAAISAYSAENYYGFCATLRGLLEACSDTFYSISKIIDPICNNFSQIEIALNGEAKKVLLSEPIEDELIHYSHARKLDRSEKGVSPDSHNAQQVRKYLDSIKDQGVLDFYAELCQVSHPSAMSLSPFLISTEDYAVILLESPVDKELNDNLLKRHKPAILTASNLSVLPAICTLKLINKFKSPITEALRTDEKALELVITTELWKSMKKKIKLSQGVS